jgi:hypothetical protein
MNEIDGFDSFESLEYRDEETVYAAGFDAAFIGLGTQFNKDLAVYDFEKCIDILMGRDGMSYDEAIEYMDFNVIGAYVGAYTPVFLNRYEDSE